MFFDSRKVRIGDLKLRRMEREIPLVHQSQVKSLLTLMRYLSRYSAGNAQSARYPASAIKTIFEQRGIPGQRR